MKIRRFCQVPLLVLICLLLSAAGCVYYNTFFNARQAFDEAEKQRKSKGVGSSGGYQTAIDKALKVVENHPNSGYYDDALYVLGVSYYYTNQPLKSERRCRELLANYPESKYAKEMMLYLARAKLKLKEEEEAFKLFEEIFEGKYSKEYRAEAAIELGQYQREQKEFAEAERYFRAVRDSLGNDRQQLAAQKNLADSYFDSYKFSDALSGYLQILGMKPDKSESYLALYRSALCSYRLQRISAGMDYLDKLIKDPLYYDSVSALQITVGQGYEYSGDLVQAEATYEEVATTTRNQAKAAEAYYRLGLIYQFDYDDLAKAKWYYDKSAEANRTTDAGKDALQRASDIAKMQNLSKSAEEALAAELQSMKDKAAKDSLSADTGIHVVDSSAHDSTKVVADSTPTARDTITAPRDTVGPAPTYDSTAPVRNTLTTPVDTSAIVVSKDTAAAARDTLTTPADTSAKVAATDSATAVRDTLTTPVEPSATFVVPKDSAAAGRGTVTAPPDTTKAAVPKDSSKVPGDSTTVSSDTVGHSLGAEQVADSGKSVPPAPGHAAFGVKENADSLAAGRAAADSIATARKAAADTLAARKAIQDRMDNAGKTLYQLAELFWFQLDKPDSAINELEFLLDHYSTSAVAPRALIALSQMRRDYLADSLGADSLLRVLLKQYPRSEYVPQALTKLNLLGSPADTGYASLYFDKAENFLIDSGNVDSALYYYQYVADHFKESPLYLQARFSIIWVTENYRSPGDSSVFAAYKMFADSFPGSPYAQEATRKITYRPPEKRPAKEDKDEVKGKEEEGPLVAQPAALKPEEPDSAGAYVDPRLRASIGPKGEDLITLDIEPVVISVEFDFPAEAYGEQQDEYQLYFQILLDFSGKVVDYELKLPCSVEEINKRALRTVGSMEFDPLAVNKELTSKSLDLILPEDKADPRGRWYVYKFVVKKPGHAR